MSTGATVNIFLSASAADPQRDQDFLRGADAVANRVAVRALAATVFALPGARLIFGGHPTASPLVLSMARQLGAMNRVEIYQSEWFRKRVPADSLAFPQIHWVSARQCRRKSLLALRKAMLRDRPLAASFFIGGTRGVLTEWEMLLGRGVPMHPVASTGGAALMLFERSRQQVDPRFQFDLEHQPVFGHLFRRILLAA